MAEKDSPKGSTEKIAYISFTTFWNALDKLEQDGIPAKVDASVFFNYSGSTTSQLLAAFRFMGLIDDAGTPTDDLQSLVDPKTRKEIMEHIVRRSYSKIFDEIDISNASSSQLDDAIRSYGIQGATLLKARSFFVKALEEAGMEVSNYVKIRAGRPTGGSSTEAANGGKPRKPRKPRKNQGRQSNQPLDPDLKEPTDAWSLRIGVGEKGFAELTVKFDPFEISPKRRNELLEIVDAYQELAKKWNEEKEAGE